MSKATGLGLTEDGIYEVVIETSSGGKVNRAPMGLVREGDILKLRIYRDSTTFRNLAENGEGKIYVVEDSRFLYETDNPRWSAMALFTVREQEGGDPIVLKLEIFGVKSLKKEIKPINRAPGLFTEFLIDLSRKDDPECQARLRHYCSVIEKVAPGSYYDKKTKELSR